MYQLTASPNLILRTADGAFIPADPENIDYQDYLKWIEEGNQAAPATPVETPGPSVPVSVTQRQARHALIDDGKYAEVQAAVASATGPDGQKLQVDWEFASTIDRASPSVGVLADILGWTDEYLDQLFIKAAQV